MRRLAFLVFGLAIIGFAAFWLLSAPERGAPDRFAGVQGDATRGALVFAAAGCASCHAAPDAEGEAKLVLAGGVAFPSDFGTFYAPNISPDPTHGIGSWTVAQLGDAMQHGVSPDGAHYYPAFPYTSYTHAKDGDIADLWAYLNTLPASDTASQPHEVGVPFSIRRGLGLWKLMFMSDDWAVSTADTPESARGRYLVESLGHCTECHTPRNALGGLDRARWLLGAPSPNGKGKVPALHGIEWSAEDIAYYLETGFTPDFDSAGGEMAAVVQNTALLPPEDRAAIAAYIKGLAP